MARYFNTYDSKMFPNDADHQGLGTDAQETALVTYIGAKTGLSFGSEEDNKHIIVDGTVTVGSGDTSFPSTGVLVVKDKYISFTNNGRFLIGSSSNDDCHVYFLNCNFMIDTGVGFGGSSNACSIGPNVTRSQDYTLGDTGNPTGNFINCTFNHVNVSNGVSSSTNWTNIFFNDITDSTKVILIPDPQENRYYSMDKAFIDNFTTNYSVLENGLTNVAWEPAGEITSANGMNVQSSALYNFNAGLIVFENLIASGNQSDRDQPGIVGVNNTQGTQTIALSSPFDDPRADGYLFWRPGTSEAVDGNGRSLGKTIVCVGTDLKFFGNEEKTVGRPGLTVQYFTDLLTSGAGVGVLGGYAPGGQIFERGDWTTANNGSDTSVSYLQTDYDVFTFNVAQNISDTILLGENAENTFFGPSFLASYDTTATPADNESFNTETVFDTLTTYLEVFSFLGITYRRYFFGYDGADRVLINLDDETFSETNGDLVVSIDNNDRFHIIQGETLTIDYDGTELEVVVKSNAISGQLRFTGEGDQVSTLNGATSVDLIRKAVNDNYNTSNDRVVKFLQEDVVDSDDPYLEKYSGDTVAAKKTSINSYFGNNTNLSVTLNDIYAMYKSATDEPSAVGTIPYSQSPYVLTDRATNTLDITRSICDRINFAQGNARFNLLTVFNGSESIGFGVGHIGPNTDDNDKIEKLIARVIDMNGGRIEANVEATILDLNNSTSSLDGTGNNFSARNCSLDGEIEIEINDSDDRYILLDNITTDSLVVTKSGSGSGQLRAVTTNTDTTNFDFSDANVIHDILTQIVVTHPDEDHNLQASEFTYYFEDSNGTELTPSVSYSDNVATFRVTHASDATFDYAIHYLQDTDLISYEVLSGQNEPVDTANAITATLVPFTANQIQRDATNALAPSVFTADNGTDGTDWSNGDATLRVRVNSSSTTNLSNQEARYTIQNGLVPSDDWIKLIARGDVAANEFDFNSQSIVIGDNIKNVLDLERQTAVTSPAWFWNANIVDSVASDYWNLITTSTDAGKVIYFSPSTDGAKIASIQDELDARLLTRDSVGNIGLGIPAKGTDGNLYTTPSV